MDPAKRLEKFGLLFYGPYSPELFKAVYMEPEGFETVVIGSGESKAVAAIRAVAHLKGKGYGPVMDKINDEMRFHLPAQPQAVEGDDYCAVYCVLGVSAER